MGIVIPDNINTFSRLQIATFFRDEGLPVIPFVAKKKTPAIKGWPSLKVSDCNDAFLKKWWGGAAVHDLAVAVQAPVVILDLDGPSTPEVVLDWVSQQPLLCEAPREATSRGVHIWLSCPSMPTALRSKGVLKSTLPGGIGAELFVSGRAIRTTPSGLSNGGQYQFDPCGPVPEISWQDLSRILGLAVETEKKPRGRPKEEKPGAWKKNFKGDLKSLDVAGLISASEFLRGVPRSHTDDPRHKIHCPWHNEHGTPIVVDVDEPDGSTVVFEGDPDNRSGMPGFHCLHSGCSEKTIKEFLLHLESAEPGLVDSHCAITRPLWNGEGSSSQDGRRQIVLPALGRPLRDFTTEVGKVIGPMQVWFFKDGSVVRILSSEREGTTTLSFEGLQPAYVRSALEAFVETGVLTEDSETEELTFSPHSANSDVATALIASPMLTDQLPPVQRVLAAPIPLRLPDGDFDLPVAGYDERFATFTQPGAPEIMPVSLEEAKATLINLHAGFCLADAQSGVHAIARLITPYCRGIIGFGHRPPVWHYSANRPRAGKDYLAGLAPLVFEGAYTEDAPLGKQPEETRKRITSAIRSGRRSMHFANCQGHLDDENFIGAVTKVGYGDRSLGSNAATADLQLTNEIEFSFSGNAGLTFRPDVEPRTRKIELFFGEADPNARKFHIPDLHGYVLAHRWRIIAAIHSLVQAWLAAGAPLGRTPFTSFPRWAAVIGGLMTFHGLGDPCLPHSEEVLLCEADVETAAMRALFESVYAELPEQWLVKADLTTHITKQQAEVEAFEVFDDLAEKSGQTRFGMILRRYVGRELVGITLRSDTAQKKKRLRYKFTKQDGPAPANVFSATNEFSANHTGNSMSNAPEGITAQYALEHPKNTPLSSQFCPPCPPFAPSGSSQPKDLKKTKTKKEKGERFFFSELDLAGSSDLKQQKGGQGGHETAKNGLFRGNLLVRRSDLAEVAAQLAEATSIALDLETYGAVKGDALNPRIGQIRILTLRQEGGPVHMLDLRAIGYDLDVLADVLEGGAEIIAHNAKFNLAWLAEKCGVRPTRVFCTCTASRLLGHGLKEGHGLDKVIERYLGVPLPADQSRSDWSTPRLTQEQLAYAAADVTHLHQLAEKLRVDIVAAGLSEVVALEMKVLSVVVGMERSGVPVDVALLNVIADEAAQASTARETELRNLLGVPALNLASPKQIREALDAIGCFIGSTGADALKEVTDKTGAIAVLLEHRKHIKTSQQALSLLNAVGSDGRIHCSFNPCGTDTGRFSSSGPNLQNVPRGIMRTAFAPAGGRCLIVADYSQIELRIAAIVAGETMMLEAYAAGADIHKETAAAVLGKAVGDVTKDDRQLAKAVNFGLLYGQRAKGLVEYAASSYGVTLTEQKAEQIRNRFFARYQGLKRWHSQAWRKAEEGLSEVRTRLGRRRILPDHSARWARFSTLVNTEVQGGAADGMKRALVDLAGNLPNGAFIVSTVHDEVIVEAPVEIAEQVKELTRSAMIKAMSHIYPEVPIEVEAGVCTSWGGKG